MSSKTYECPSAGKTVQVLMERIILDDEKLGAKRVSHELVSCSQVEEGSCLVRKVPEPDADMPGREYANTAECNYLRQAKEKS